MKYLESLKPTVTVRYLGLMELLSAEPLQAHVTSRYLC